MKFTRVNHNPRHRMHEPDSFIRCLCVVTGRDWNDIYDEIYEVSRKQNRMMNSDIVQRKFLKKYFFVEEDIKIHSLMTVQAYERLYIKDENVRIFKMNNGAFTVSVGDMLYDIYDNKAQKISKVYRRII